MRIYHPFIDIFQLVDFHIISGFINYVFIMIVIGEKALVWLSNGKFDVLKIIYHFICKNF